MLCSYFCFGGYLYPIDKMMVINCDSDLYGNNYTIIAPSITIL